MTNGQEALRFVRVTEVLRQTGIGSKSELYRRVKDGRFPQPIRISHRIAVWLEHEIQDWMRTQIATSREARDSLPR